MRQIKIAFDFDKTIAQYKEDLYLKSKRDLIQKYMCDVDKCDYIEKLPNKQLYYNMPMDIIYHNMNKYYEDDHIMTDMVISDDTIRVLNNLHNTGNYNMHIVTARPPNLTSLIPTILKNYNLEKIFTDNKIHSSKDKYKFCIHNNINVIIDDKPSTILECSDNGIPSILYISKETESYNGKYSDMCDGKFFVAKSFYGIQYILDAVAKFIK